MKIKSSSYVLIAILLLTLVIVVSSFTMEKMKQKMVPITVGSIVFVLSAVELAKELVRANRTNEIGSAEVSTPLNSKRKEILKYTVAFIWLSGFVAAIYFFGFVLGSTIFIFSFLKTHGRSWLKSTIITVISTLVIYVLFVMLLEANLFPGILFGGIF